MFLFRHEPFTVENVQSEIFMALKRQGYAVPYEVDSMSSNGISYTHEQWPSNTKPHVFWSKDNPAVPFRENIGIYDFINFLKN